MTAAPEENPLAKPKRRPRRIAAMASFGIGAILMAAATAWVLGSYLGPVQIVEGTVDVAAEGGTLGGTGVRGTGGRALDIILQDRLSDTPYQPTFRLNIGYFEEETPYRLSQLLPRGTAITMAVRPADLASTLQYGEERHALEQAGERYSHSIITPEWLVPIVALQFDQDDAVMTRDMNRAAIWILASIIFGLGMASFAAGRLYLRGEI